MNRAHSLIVGACSWLANHTGAAIVGLAVVWMTSTPWPAWAQSAVWQPQGATTGNIYYNGGSVGIGMPNPSYTLQINGILGLSRSYAETPTQLYQINGNGILQLQGHYSSNQEHPVQIAVPDNTGAIGFYTSVAVTPPTLPAFLERMRITADGNVGIGTGTTNPVHLLQVAGTIGAEEVLVTSTGADYVFHPGYRLQPLSEVDAYIQANHHLPDIPSEAEVKQKGMGVGEMEAKLLAKVEELTLHMIQAEKENRDLRGRLARLEKGADATPTAK